MGEPVIHITTLDYQESTYAGSYVANSVGIIDFMGESGDTLGNYDIQGLTPNIISLFFMANQIFIDLNQS